MLEPSDSRHLFTKAEKIVIPGSDVAHDFFQAKTPKTRWNIEGRDAQGRSSQDHLDLPPAVSLYATDVRAARLFHHWIPWQPRKLTEGSTFLLSDDAPVKARNFINAALLSGYRHLDFHAYTPDEIRRVVKYMGDPSCSTLNVIQDMESLRKHQGEYATLKELQNEKLQQRHPRRFFRDEDDSGEHPLPKRKAGRRDAASLHSRVKRQNLELDEAIEAYEETLSKLRARIDRFTLPVKLLTAAVDLAHVENIWHAPPDVRQAYLRRVRYFHAPLLHRLGYHAESAHYQDLAMRVLNPSEFKWISRDREHLAQHHEAILNDLANFVRQHDELSMTASNVVGRPKSAYGLYTKLTEPPDEDGLSGPDKYGGEVNNVHDALAYKVVKKGNDVEDVEDIKEHLLSHLPGKSLGGFTVERVELKKNYLKSPKPGSGYRAAHAIIHFKLREDLDVPWDKQLRKIELQLVNERLDRDNQSASFTSHAEYKGLERRPEEHDYVPPQHSQRERTITVHGPDGRERNFHPFEGEDVWKLLHYLGPQVLGEHMPVPQQAIGGHLQVYDQAPEVKRGIHPIALSRSIEDGVVYHVRRVPEPVPPAKQVLIHVKKTADEPDWLGTIEDELDRRQQMKRLELDDRRKRQADKKKR